MVCLPRIGSRPDQKNGVAEIVALKVRELLQPAAKERQREAAANLAARRERKPDGTLNRVSVPVREPGPVP